MNKVLIILFALLTLMACKDQSNDANSVKKEIPEGETPGIDQVAQQEMDSSFPVNPIKLPNPCSLIEKDEIAKIFNIDAELINVKPTGRGQGQGQNNSSSCFYTWDDGSNGGFLLQVMKNPMYGEFENWASSYIQVLSTTGETSYPDNIQHKYEKFDGPGDAAAYNANLGKVFWRIGEELVVGIIFKSTDDISSISDVSRKIGAITNKRITIEK
jgi:hypothetical protein